MQADNRKILREIGAFSFPAIAERLLLVVIGMVSTVFVGRLGTSELAAVSVATTVQDILLALFSGLGLGATILVARAVEGGRGEDEIKSLSFHALVLSAAAAVLLGTAVYFSADWLIGTMFSSLTEVTKNYAIHYLRMELMVAIPLALDVAVSSCLRGVKDSRSPFIFTALVNAVNIVLCLLFIYGMDMGIDGAAWAYILSTLAGGAAKVIFIMSGKARITLRRFMAMKKETVQRILHLAIPSMLGQFLIQIAFLGVQMVTALIGDVALAGYQVANNMLKLLYTVTTGLEQADVTLTGIALGKGSRTEARRYARTILIVGEVSTILIGVLLFIFAEPCAKIFTRDQEVIESAKHLLRIMCFTIPLTSCFQCIQGVLKTGGQNMLVVVFNLIGPWFIRIPLAYIAVRFWNMGIYGLIVGFFSDYLFRAGGESIVFFREKWMDKKV